MAKATTKKKPTPETAEVAFDHTGKLAPSGKPWLFGIRTCGSDGSSHGGYLWDLTIGACNEAFDWKAVAECGNGLHANEDGWGDWALLGLDSDGAGKVTLITKWDPEESVRIDEAKTKARRMWVVMTSKTASLGSILGFIQGKWRERLTAELAANPAKTTNATGNSGHAAATGNSGHAAATGDSGHAAATGNSGHAAATGDSGHAAATGDSGHAAATGDSGHAAATGDSGHAAATGNSGHAAATGDSGHAAATGDSGHAAATGNSGHAAATGNSGHAAATGDSGHAAATGNSGHAAATGGGGIAASIGPNGQAKASATGAIMLAHHRYDSASNRYELIAVFAGMVGQTYGAVTIKPDTAYRLGADGVPVEVG